MNKNRVRWATILIAAGVLVPLATVRLAGRAVATDGNGGGHVTWLSGVGDDANPCSRTAPCKTFAGTFSKTAQPGGEIRAEEPGNFGNPSNSNPATPTINGGIVFDGSPGYAVMQTSVAGADGFDIAAAANDVVVLRNIDVQGFGIGLHGINFISGKALYIEDSVIEGFTGDGVHVAPAAGGRVVIENSTIRNNGGNGVNATGASPTALATVTVEDSRIEGNGAAGVLAADYSDVTVDGTNASHNAQAIACVTQSTGNCTITASTNTISQNTTGVLAGRGVPGASGNATVYITGNTISGNDKGLSVTATPSFGRIYSLGDNTVVDNRIPGTVKATIPKM